MMPNDSAPDAPAYTAAEAARYLDIAPATLRSWVVGRPYPTQDGPRQFEPLIRLPHGSSRLLSFSNLIEAHVLRALRRKHGVSIRAVRDAIRYAESELGISRLLLSPELRAGAGHLFIQRYGDLINLSRSGQLALQRILEAHLERVEWETNRPSRLYPFPPGRANGNKIIAIDPHIGFGRPIVASKGISTAVIADRIDAGESVRDVADDYDLGEDEVEAAVIYERAA